MTSNSIATTIGTADEEFIKEILREAEDRLSAQLTAAIAADQRAMTFLGFLLTIVVFLIGAGLTAASTSGGFNIALIAGFGSAGFAVAGFFAYKATRPIEFEFVGNDPESWLEDIAGSPPVTLKAALAEQCEHYDAMLKTNRRAMSDGAENLRTSTAIAVASVAVCAGGALAKVLLGL